MIITVDGISGSGKGTLSAQLASHYNLPLIETGVLWRKLAYIMSNQGYDTTNESDVLNAMDHMGGYVIEDSDLRNDEISDIASIISGYADARARMDGKIANWVFKSNGGAVLDGRDCGRTIVKDADHKFFLVCDIHERAKRRAKATGYHPSVHVAGLADRDHREINRSVAPSIPAEDAIIIDTTNQDIESVLNLAVLNIEARAKWFQIYRDATF